MAALNARDIPNLLTVFRLALVPPVVWLLLEQRFASALWLFAAAGLTDALDGYLAKRFDWSSRLGSVLDPVADKLLLVCAYATLGWLGVLPAWLVLAVLGRDLVIVIGAFAYHRLIGYYEFQPTWISKWNTFLQILLVLAAILHQAAVVPPAPVLVALEYVVLVTTVWSGADYVWTWSRRAWARR